MCTSPVEKFRQSVYDVRAQNSIVARVLCCSECFFLTCSFFLVDRRPGGVDFLLSHVLRSHR